MMKRREILYILQEGMDYDSLNRLHIISSEFMHYLELPCLKHFISVRNFAEIFRNEREALLDISFDDIQNVNEGDENDFLKA